MFTCKICGKKFTELSGLYGHLERLHAEMIPQDMTTAQYYYYTKTGRTNGNCVICKQATTWNDKTGKYNRFCNDPRCKQKYSAEFKKRMIGKYGKTHLLNDPQKQREMLSKRSISGEYEWDNDNRTKTPYTGSYELDFLKMMDGFLDWDPQDIIMPSPHNYVYMYDGEEKFYIPDAFIPSLDLEIEIKDGGDNPNMHHKIQDVDKVKEKNKDDVLTSQKAFNYIKITNKNYTNFFDFLKEAKALFEKYGDSKSMPKIFKIEDIRVNSKPDADDKKLTESFNLKDFITKMNEVTFDDMELFISTTYDVKKENPEELKKYLSKLVKGAKSSKDIMFIKKLVGTSLTYYHSKGKKFEGMGHSIEDYREWLNSDFSDELNKRIKKLKKDSNIIFEANDDDIENKINENRSSEEVVEESSISFAKINEYLQDDNNMRIGEYMDTYSEYYNRMLQEKPESSKHINSDIHRAKVYINDLKRSGKVNKKLAIFALKELEDIIDGESLFESITNNCNDTTNSFKIQILYNPLLCPRQAFGLNDSNSKVFIDGRLSMQRFNDPKKCSCCKTTFENIELNDNKLLEFMVTMQEPINLNTELERLNSMEDVKLNRLFNPKDFQNGFIYEVCSLIGARNAAVTRLSSDIY